MATGVTLTKIWIKTGINKIVKKKFTPPIKSKCIATVRIALYSLLLSTR